MDQLGVVPRSFIENLSEAKNRFKKLLKEGTSESRQNQNKRLLNEDAFLALILHVTEQG